MATATQQKHAVADGTPHKPNPLVALGGELFEDFFNSVAEQMEENAGLNDEQNSTLKTYIQTSEKSIVEKRDRLGAFLARLDGEADAIKKEEQRLAARRRNFEKISECLKSSIHQQMLDSGVKKVEGHLTAFAVQRNPSSVEIVNEQEIPAEFISYEPRIDRRAVKDALESGKEVAGAKLITDKTHLRIY